MSMMKRSIFRERAIQHYRRGREKDVLPRFVSPPVFLGLWLVVSLCLIAGWLAWNIRVPVSIPAIGMVVSGETQAVIFVSADHQQSLHQGEPVQVQIGSAGPFLRTITTVVPGLLSPEEARQRYHLDGALSFLVTEPSVVLVIALDASTLASNSAGSIVHGEVQVGEVSILSFLPIVGQLIGA